MFNKEWTLKYFSVDVAGGKALCLVCKSSVTVFKEYNLNQYFESKHAAKCKNMLDEEKASQSHEMVA